MDDRFSQQSLAEPVAGAQSVRARTPGFGTAVVALVVGLALALLLTGIVHIVTQSLTAALLLGEVGFLAGVAALLAARGHRLSDALRIRPVPAGAYVPAFKLGIALLLANVAATVLLGPPAQDVEFVISADSLVERVALVIGVALGAPIIEEALFRGLLQGALETRMRPWFAISIAGSAFAALHGPEGALFFFFWSLPVGWVTWRLGSIGPAVVVHAINNLVGLMGLFAAGQIEPASLEHGAAARVIAVLLLAAAALWTVRLCARMSRLTAAGAEQSSGVRRWPGPRSSIVG
jgi:membrane protease YdiL (CAAX protease family)